MTRKPVPLRCNSCGEVIYQDQKWEDYDGGDDESPGLPWHSECAEASRLARRAMLEEHRARMAELRKKPRESLSYEELSCLSMADSTDSLLDVITKDIEFFGPGMKRG